MKRSMSVMAATALMIALCSNADPLPGEVDFGEFTPPHSGGEFVEVNIGSNLIALAAHIIPKKQAEVAKLLNNLQLVRVNVIGLDPENRNDLKSRAEKIQKSLKSQGWERIVTAQEKGQDVGVHIKMRGKDSILGVAVIVLDKDQAVFVNIVGDVTPDQIALVGEQLNIAPLKKLGPKLEQKKSEADPEK